MGSISRYIFRTTFGAFLTVLGSLTAVIWVTQALRDIDLITNEGQMVRIPVDGIREAGRNTQGVRLVNLDDGDTLIGMAQVIGLDEEEEGVEGAVAPEGTTPAAPAPETPPAA